MSEKNNSKLEEKIMKLEENYDKMEKNYSKQKHQLGITLVALMVTIIVLLILAGVTIAELTGNGMFVKAQISKERQKDAEGLEQNVLSDYEKQLSSARDVGDGAPIGTVIAFMGTTAPTNYLPCDGRVLNVSEYGELFNVLKTADHSNWATADWSTTFSLPNLQGEFLRGTGTNGYTNQGNGETVGQHQNNGLPNITGYFYAHCWGLQSGYSGAFQTSGGGWCVPTGQNGSDGRSTAAFNASWSNNIYGASSYVTPTNTSVLYCIKAK